MPWHYPELPEEMRMPPCRQCKNRMKVKTVMRHVYACGDCGEVFAAVWKAEQRADTEERASRTG